MTINLHGVPFDVKTNVYHFPDGTVMTRAEYLAWCHDLFAISAGATPRLERTVHGDTIINTVVAVKDSTGALATISTQLDNMIAARS